MKNNNVGLATLNNSKYWVYCYKIKLNGIDNAVVLFCWSKNAFTI